MALYVHNHVGLHDPKYCRETLQTWSLLQGGCEKQKITICNENWSAQEDKMQRDSNLTCSSDHKTQTLKLGLSGVLKASSWVHKVLQHNKARPAVSRSSRCLTRMVWMQYQHISEGCEIKSLCSVWWRNRKWRSFTHQAETLAKIILVMFWRTWRDKITGTGHKWLKNLRQSKNLH